ncbi:MAG: N-6 DNA methylase [Halobacteriales archaeon]|nr:N-6 DNA methylase [Halobacteriales archaeon]
MTLDEDEFTPETVEYVRNADDERRKEMGQYFTPRSVRERLFDSLLSEASFDAPSVLDPACGTGEFLLTVSQRVEDAELVGWEVDDEVAEIAREVVPDARIETTDALRHEPEREFDIVVGNPPYFEFDPDDDLRERYSESVYGRVNIYSLFIQKGIEVLRDGGLLGYVVPPSVKNGAYFSAVREYVLETCEVVHLSTLEDAHLFHGANQTPMLMVLRKGGDSDRYVFSENGVTILSEDADRLRDAFEGARTLLDMGYEVETGALVWNQHRDVLTDRGDEDTVPVVWSRNVTDEGLVLDNHDKPQYVERDAVADKIREGPAIAVNRVVGKPGSGSLRACMIPEGKEFVGENHVNLVFPPETRQTTLDSDGDGTLPIEEVLRQLNSEEKTEVLRSITGNTQVSKNELLKLFPFEVGAKLRNETP